MENVIPRNPILNITSMVPHVIHVIPVKRYKSLANVIPGRKLVKET